MNAPSLLVLAALAGCHAEIAKSEIDASVFPQDDAAPISEDAPITPTPDAPPACATGRVVYLNFEGTTLTKGASDATQNRAAWMGVTTATLPPYKAGNANRAQLITDITNLVTTQLAQFPEIKVVTQRPQTGPYVMIGFGGDRTIVNVPYTIAVQQLDCGDAAKSDVAWVFDPTPAPQKAADFAIGAIGFGLGLTGTTDPTDCMCGWATNCTQTASGCALHAAVTAQLSCAGQTNPQDEIAAFQAFCQ